MTCFGGHWNEIAGVRLSGERRGTPEIDNSTRGDKEADNTSHKRHKKHKSDLPVIKVATDQLSLIIVLFVLFVADACFLDTLSACTL